MNGVNVSLGHTGRDAAIFYDFHYKNDGEGGNREQTVFEITNLSGNSMTVETAVYATNTRTQKTELCWERPLEGCDAVRITFNGTLENSEFLQMLRLILEAEKMVGIVKP
jgi:hypothetical protein